MSTPPGGYPAQTPLCVFCMSYFRWKPPKKNDTAPLYCSKKCRSKAKLAARNLRDLMVTGRCPTPDKRGFPDNTAADRHRAAHPDHTAGNRPYLCVCGQFHLGRLTRGDAVERGLLNRARLPRAFRPASPSTSADPTI